MKRLRYVVVPGQAVEPGECYLMAAIPTLVVEPGPKLIGERKINMNMVPVRLEWVDMDTDEATPIVLEEIAPPKLVVPK